MAKPKSKLKGDMDSKSYWAKQNYREAERSKAHKQQTASNEMRKSNIIDYEAGKKTQSKELKADFEGQKMYSNYTPEGKPIPKKDPFAYEEKKRPKSAAAKAQVKAQQASKSRLSKQKRKYFNNQYNEGE